MPSATISKPWNRGWRLRQEQVRDGARRVGPPLSKAESRVEKILAMANNVSTPPQVPL